MEDNLRTLIAKRKRLVADFNRMPEAWNFEGKKIPKKPSAYLIELDRRIAALQKGD